MLSLAPTVAIDCEDGSLSPMFDPASPIASDACYDIYLTSFTGVFVAEDRLDVAYEIRHEKVGTGFSCMFLPTSLVCSGSAVGVNTTVSNERLTWGTVKSVYR